MQLNKETEELLIDYIFGKDTNEVLDSKYVGLENIILQLVQEGKVTISDTSENDIEEFLESFPFIKPIETELYKLHKYEINIDKVITDKGFKIYRENEISNQLKEIKHLEKEISESVKTIKDLDLMIVGE